MQTPLYTIPRFGRDVAEERLHHQRDEENASQQPPHHSPTMSSVPLP